MSENTDRLAGLSDAKRALLERLVAERKAAAAAIRPRPRPERVPLSFGQERLWLVEQFAPGSAAYNEPIVLWLDGALDTAALDRALEELVRRHEALRTAVPSEGGKPFQKIADRVSLPIEIRDLSMLPEEQAREEALRMARRVIAAPFELAQGPLVRAIRVRVAMERHLLAIAIHHLFIDGWSIGVFLDELSKIYNAFVDRQPSPLAEPALQYADYAMWQREWLDGERMEKQVAYWREQLDGCPSVLDLPAVRPRPPVQSFRGSVVRRQIPLDLYEAMEQFSRRENVTPFMTLFAVWTTLLHRWTGQLDIPVGVGMANRPRAELESLVGFFVNTLVLRTSLDGSPTFRALLAQVRESTLGAQANQDAPLSRVVESMSIDRAASHMPFVQIMLFFQNYAQQAEPMRGLDVRRIPLDEVHPGSAQTDVALFINQDGAGELLFQFSTDLFDHETIESLAGNMIALLRGAIGEPDRRIGELPLLTEQERGQLQRWNDTTVAYPGDRPVAELLRAQAVRTPAAVAVTCNGRSLTYRELHRRAEALAHALRKQGVQAGALVGLYIERSLEMVIGLAGIIEAEAAYVPLDPSYPADRLSFMLEDSGARVVVTQQSLRDDAALQHVTSVIVDANSELVETERGESMTAAAPDDLAYVIFTSGSTGRPKGVQLTHRATVNLLTTIAREPGMTADDVICAVSTLSFDIAMTELVLPLTVGARIVLADRDTARDGTALTRLLDSSDITIMQATPATWRMLLDAGWCGKPGLKIISTGEALPRELAERLRPCGRELWNLYGPTETTVYSTLGRVDAGDGPVSIGRPVANTQIHIVDRYFQQLPPGVPGELLIGGDGLARGYLGRPDLTAEKFIPDPFSDRPDARLYRAGDLAVWRRDGTLEVLGRMDHQVKLRGFRIELGEIEAALAEHAAVEQAVVHCREDRPGDKRLVAYVTAAGNLSPSADTLRSHLRQSLPDYMIPSAFVVLERFPLTPNGKVNRQALPMPELQAGELAASAPQSADEREMAELWSQVLGHPHIGRNDNFFDLGGHSLLATQLLARIQKTLAIEVPLRVLFETPTVAGLASYVAAERSSALEYENLDELLSALEQLSEEEASAGLGLHQTVHSQSEPHE